VSGDEPRRRSERIVYDGRVVKVGMADVELPGGRAIELEIIRHPGASAIVPFSGPEEVLLIHQYRFAADGRLWEVPAGKLDAGEDPERCAARELGEETGRRAGRIEKLGSIFTTPGFTDEVIHLFAGWDLEEVGQQLEHDELIEVVPTPFDEAIRMVFDGRIHDGKSALAILHAARRAGRLGPS
jgi:ADP-ribose pyrophosphatase